MDNLSVVSGRDYSYNLFYFGELNSAKWFGVNEAKHTPVDTSRLMMIVENAEDTTIAEEITAPCGETSAKNEFIAFSILQFRWFQCGFC